MTGLQNILNLLGINNSTAKTLWRAVQFGLVAATLMGTAPFAPSALGGEVTNMTAGESHHAGTLEVPVNKSQVLKVDQPFAQALIGNADIADILPLTKSSVYILGKKVGSTSLTLYDKQKTLISVVDIMVGPDVIGLRQQLSDLMPNERIGARISNNSIVLSGGVSSAVAVDRALQVADTYSPGKVVNMMSVGSSQQVLLEVRFSEMKRSVAKQIGLNSAFRSNSGSFSGGTGGASVNSTILTNKNGTPSVDLTGILESFGIIGKTFNIGNVNIAGVLDALESKGVVTTLAEPNLVALSGDTASFLAGGEFPVPVSRDNNNNSGTTGNANTNVTVEFKSFGVSLAFTPTVLEDGLINLIVAPEVSSIDPSASVVINGLVIPGLKTRRARTTLELRDGQSFAIAGLISKDFQDTVKQFPVLGSIPIIGALFRSTGFQRDETELVIVVTPRLIKPTTPDKIVLPTDRVQEPNELGLFMNGTTDSAVNQNPIVNPEMTKNPPKGPTGIDGPHGHIVE
jgi:pilus assembly protein CpaC